MPMSADSCLGIVDWGIGGVGLVRALDQLAPGLPLLYWADTGVTPYGRMGTDELTARLTTVVSVLAQMGATEVVLACNAASTVVGRLGAAPVAVEGIIGHGVACVPDEIAGPVGVVGGRRTIAGGHYRRGLARPGRTVLSRVAQPLSAHIEAGRAGSPQFLADLARILAPLRRVDALVLACPHYPAASRHCRTTVFDDSAQMPLLWTTSFRMSRISPK
jgi:glutamate racemase